MEGKLTLIQNEREQRDRALHSFAYAKYSSLWLSESEKDNLTTVEWVWGTLGVQCKPWDSMRSRCRPFCPTPASLESRCSSDCGTGTAGFDEVFTLFLISKLSTLFDLRDLIRPVGGPPQSTNKQWLITWCTGCHQKFRYSRIVESYG